MRYGILQPNGMVKVVSGNEASAHYAAKPPATRTIGSHRVGRYAISTVFLMLDHAFTETRPQWFETIVFALPRGGSENEIDQERYTTKAEALIGHARHVAAMRKRVADELAATKKKEPKPTARAPINLTKRKIQL